MCSIGPLNNILNIQQNNFICLATKILVNFPSFEHDFQWRFCLSICSLKIVLSVWLSFMVHFFIFPLIFHKHLLCYSYGCCHPCYFITPTIAKFLRCCQVPHPMLTNVRARRWAREVPRRLRAEPQLPRKESLKDEKPTTQWSISHWIPK